jgi:hypothetical protein
MHGMLKILVPSGVIFILLAMLVGCGSEDPAALLQESLERTSHARSAKVELQVEATPKEGSQGIPLNLQGTALVDFANQKLEATLGMMGINLEMRLVEGKAYLNFGKDWFVFSPAKGRRELSELAGSGELFFSYLELLGHNSRVKSLGEEKVAGRASDHLEVIPDLDEIAQLPWVVLLAERAGMKKDEIVGFLEDLELKVEVWVDKNDSLVRKILVFCEVELSRMENFGLRLLEGPWQLKVNAVFPDYDVPVEVEAPQGAEPFDTSKLPL